MPNHVTHRILVTGPAPDLARLVQTACGGADQFGNPHPDGTLNLHALVPMPPAVRDTPASLLEPSGADNWYTWSLLHWGTKS